MFQMKERHKKNYHWTATIFLRKDDCTRKCEHAGSFQCETKEISDTMGGIPSLGQNDKSPGKFSCPGLCCCDFFRLIKDEHPTHGLPLISAVPAKRTVVAFVELIFVLTRKTFDFEGLQTQPFCF